MMCSYRIRVAIVTVVPSPYQLDLFRELAALPNIDLHVYYLEEETPGLPWPPTPRQAHETVLRGFWIGPPTKRFHLNWPLPDLRSFDVVVMSNYMSVTAQWLMRYHLRKKPWVFWGERMRFQPDNLKRAIQQFVSAPLTRATGIVGMGSVARSSYQERFPHLPTYNLPYYTDLDAFTRAAAGRRRGQGNEVAFLCCGQMIHRKGIDLLLAAFERLLATGARARLLLVGPEADLPAMLASVSENTRQKVEYRGFQAPRDLPEHFADADVFVLPSRHDGWGVVVNQALGSGLPLICSDAVGAAHDLIEADVNGVMFENENVDALFVAMKRLADDRHLLAQWGEASLAMSETWSPKQGALEWVRILHSVLGLKEVPAAMTPTLETV